MRMPTDSSGRGVQPPKPLRPLVSIEDAVTIPCFDCHGTGMLHTEGATRLIRVELCPTCAGVALITLGWTSSTTLPGLRHVVRLDDSERLTCLCGLTIPTEDLHAPQGLYCGRCVKTPIGV